MAAVECSRCAAVCCRLTAVLTETDNVPAHLTTTLAAGPRVMAKDADGWCRALDRVHMRCGIYDDRPTACRRFVMDGGYCRAVRADYAAGR